MCDEAADDILPTLNFVRDWFVTSKMIKKFFTALYANENILHFNEDSDIARNLYEFHRFFLPDILSLKCANTPTQKYPREQTVLISLNLYTTRSLAETLTQIGSSLSTKREIDKHERKQIIITDF